MGNVIFIETLNETLIAHHNKRPHEEAHISFPEMRGYFFHIALFMWSMWVLMKIIKSVITANYGVVHNLHRPIFQILYVILNKSVTQKWKDVSY